jgi:hypothetical protein
MKHCRRLLVRVFIAIVAAGSMTACVSPAARVPCDGRLEPINPPAKKVASENKRADKATPKVSP